MIYLDYQATTPLAPEAKAAMLPFLDEKFANPHSPHKLGREAAAAVEVARDRVLKALLPDREPTPDNSAKLHRFGLLRDAEVEAGRLFFTSGATEAANWAIKGTWARRDRRRNRIVTVATEHACVLDTIRSLRADGAEVVEIPVDDGGVLDREAMLSAIDDKTVLVAVMLVNNEIGTIQDVAPIGLAARSAEATMFCDAVQGFGRIWVPIGACDLVAVSAHKIHGPKGVGALWVRPGFEPEPLMHGGGQEGGLRSGTLSPALCAGFGAAASVAHERTRRSEDERHVRKLFWRAISALGQEWKFNGSLNHHYHGNLNLRRDGLDAARLISELREIAFSAGSACASGSGRPSHVLKAIGLSDAQARSSIRLGFGRYTTEDDIGTAARLIDEAAARQRAFA